MKLMIVRHGDPDYIHDSLTEKGKREAELLSKRLAKMDIQEFYQSPLGRAQLTASYTLHEMHREAETLDWLENSILESFVLIVYFVSLLHGIGR